MRARLVAYPRIHITLLDTAERAVFSPGGLGFSVFAYPLELHASRSHERRLRNFGALDPPALDDVHSLLARLTTVVGFEVEISLISSPPQHVGLGSKTLLLNGIVAAVMGLADQKSSIEERQLLTGRGGTSGVGLHAFYHGGLIWDAGHKTLPIPTGLKPSSFSRPSSPPILMARWPLEGWKVALILPEGRTFSAGIERRIFQDYARYPQHEQGQLWAAVFNGVLPSLVNGNQNTLAKSLQQVHEVGFKAAELHVQTAPVKELYRKLIMQGIPCGLSSMGPLIYVLTKDDPTSSLEDELAKLDLPNVVYCSTSNVGHSLDVSGA